MRRFCALLIAAMVLTATGASVKLARADDHTRSWLPATPAGWPLVVSQTTSERQQVTAGVAVSSDSIETVAGPQRASLLDVDLADRNVRLGVVSANDRLISPGETVGSMARRTGAVAGINADFFEINASGRPINMVTVDGRLVQSAIDFAILGVTREGRLTMSHESFSGSVTDGQAVHPLTSVNIYGDVSRGGLVLATPDLGAPVQLSGAAIAFLAPAPDESGEFTVSSVSAGVDTLPVLQGQDALVGGGASADWLAANVHGGDHLTISRRTSPHDDLVQAVGGGPILVKDGATYDDPVSPSPNEKNRRNPLTGIGVSKDGRHAFMVVFDGRRPDLSLGLTQPEMASYMLQRGAYQAMLFDGGGSSEMVARLPGQTAVSVMNSPSDGRERPVANGLFVYSRETAPGPAASVVVNGGRPLTVLAGTTVSVDAYALDEALNPSRDHVGLAIVPPGLASVSGTSITAGERPGEGLLQAFAGSGEHSTEAASAARRSGDGEGAQTAVRLSVVDRLQSLAINPAAPDLDTGQTQQFTVTGSAAGGQKVPIPAGAVRWTVSPQSLGSIDAAGLFTAGTSVGLATVTATAGGQTATATVAVGKVTTLIDDMTDVQNWAVSTHNATGSISLSTTVKRQPSDAGSMNIHYDIPAGNGVKQVVFYPLPDRLFPAPGSGQNPTAVGLWVKGDNSGLLFAEAFMQVNNQLITLYPTSITFNGWKLVVANLPPGLQFPLNVWFLDFLVVNNSKPLSGDLYVSNLEAMYSPRPPAPVNYVPIPNNPSWLQFEQDPARFGAAGTTTVSFDDAHLLAGAPGSTGAVVLKAIAGKLGSLPPQAKPSMIQSQGDMSDVGELADLRFAKASLDAFGIPYHTAVGNHEISQGARPENQNYASVFGPTHYSYTNGPARFIVMDSSHIGLLASNAFQSPNEEQYAWLVSQLDANTSPVVFVTTHVPPYDPHPIKNSQMSNRWEARMYEKIAARYQQTHPHQHVILLSGHARGFAENLLDEFGNDTPNGIPNFVVADAGVPAYAPPDQGGFYNYVLFHVDPSGHVQFAVMPVLTSIRVSAPATTLAVGDHLQLSAVGTAPAGDNQKPLEVPLGDPASHFWTSSDPRVAMVDPITGKVTARAPGTVAIHCEADGIVGEIVLTVRG